MCALVNKKQVGMALVGSLLVVELFIILLNIYNLHNSLSARMSVPEWPVEPGSVFHMLVMIGVVLVSIPTIYGLTKRLRWAWVCAFLLFSVYAVQAMVIFIQALPFGLILKSPHFVTVLALRGVELLLIAMAVVYLVRHRTIFK